MNERPQTAVITASRGGYTLETPYSAEWVEAIKAAIPHQQRRWNPEDRAWWIGVGYLDEVIGLCRQEGWTVRIEHTNGQTEIIYPSGTVEVQQQDDLFGV